MKKILLCVLAALVVMAAASSSGWAQPTPFGPQLKNQLETMLRGKITGVKSNPYFGPTSLTQRANLIVNRDGKSVVVTVEGTVAPSSKSYALQSMSILDSVSTAMKKEAVAMPTQTGAGSTGAGGGTSTDSTTTNPDPCVKKCAGKPMADWFSCMLACWMGFA